MPTFSQILEEAETLTSEEQISLIEILRLRAIERRREELASHLDEAESAFRAGGLPAMSPEEILRAAESA